MHSLLSLRHYSHELLSHSHDHAQLVFGLSGLLEFEKEGEIVRENDNLPARRFSHEAFGHGLTMHVVQ